jgi:hypothetical protein
MSKDILQRTKSIWQQKGDEELIVASEHLSDYTKEAEAIIRAELKRRRMPEPEPTVRDETVRDETAKLTYLDKLKSRSLSTGVALLVCGALLLFLSSNGTFERGKKDESMLFGVFFVVVGIVFLSVGLNHFISTRPTPPPAPTTQPDVTQSVSPKSVELGNTPDEVQSVMGQPDKIMNLGARVIHVYKDMKIIYVEGKVSDVQLS